jgi:hypothetical protein
MHELTDAQKIEILSRWISKRGNSPVEILKDDEDCVVGPKGAVGPGPCHQGSRSPGPFDPDVSQFIELSTAPMLRFEIVLSPDTKAWLGLIRSVDLAIRRKMRLGIGV